MLGTGTVANPYIIQTPTDLNNVRNKITTGTYYELGNDIDMSKFGNFTSIGGSTSATRFKCSFNGKGFSIKGIKIVGSSNFVGFVSLLDTATGIIKNVSFIDANVSSTALYTGIVAGGTTGTSLISNCFTNGNVDGNYHIGGICGMNGGSVENCFSTAHVTGNNHVSGIARMDSPTTAKILSCYFNGSFTIRETINPPSIFGVSGGTVSSTRLVNSYYNIDTTGLVATSNEFGIGLTDSQMKEQSSFIGFDDTVWGFQNGNYPYLKVFGIPPIPSQKKIVNLNTHLNIISSSLERSKRKVSIALSYSTTISSESTRTLHLMKNVTSHIDEIVSNVTTLENANTKDYEVTSFVNRIGSNATRFVRTVRTISSIINPIQVITDIQIPIKIGHPVYATAYVIENPTNIDMIENQSFVNIIENHSNIKTVNNQSDTQTKENQSEMSVI